MTTHSTIKRAIATAVLGVVVSGCDLGPLEDFGELTFGQSFRLPKPSFGYHTTRAFNGDGYSIDVYELPEELAAQLTQPVSDFFSAYPKKPQIRSKWSVQKWERSPAYGTDGKHIDFALLEQSNDPSLIKAKALVRELLSDSGSYYAYLYSMDFNNPVLISLCSI